MLLKQLNQILKELPDISKKLEERILKERWTEEKQQQAIIIVGQIKKIGTIKNLICLGYNYIELVPLTITLSPRECGINHEIFESGDILQADKYIDELLKDINNISEKVKFSAGGHICETGKYQFSIDWEV